MSLTQGRACRRSRKERMYVTHLVSKSIASDNTLLFTFFPIKDQNSSSNINIHQEPVCWNADPATQRPYAAPADYPFGMTKYCIDNRGAVCSGGIVTFASSLSGGSGNPDNCGSACSCAASTCPAVMPSCGDCQGTTENGSSLGKCRPGLGKGLGRCPCIV